MQPVLQHLLIATLFFGCQNNPKETPSGKPNQTPTNTTSQAAPQPKEIEQQLYAVTLETSSFLESEKGEPYTRYHPNYAMDNSLETAWNEGSPTSGANEWLKLPIAQADGVTKVRLRVWNGYQKSDKVFQNNARIKALQITLLPAAPEDKPVVLTATLEDKMGEQEVSLITTAASVAAIELKVISVYEGKKYKDLGLSEFEVFLTASHFSSSAAEESAKHTELLSWITRQQETADLLTKGVPGSYRYETIESDVDPYPPEATLYFDKKATLDNWSEIVPVELESDDKAEYRTVLGTTPFFCTCLNDLEEGEVCESEKAPEGFLGAQVIVPCIGLPNEVNISGYKPVRAKAPAWKSECADYLWSDKASLGKGPKIRALMLSQCSPTDYGYRPKESSPETDYKVIVIYDEKGRLRLYGNEWFIWKEVEDEDILLGSVQRTTQNGKPAIKRLVPDGVATPEELAVTSAPTSTPTSTPSSSPTSKATSSPTTKATSTPTSP